MPIFPLSRSLFALAITGVAALAVGALALLTARGGDAVDEQAPPADTAKQNGPFRALVTDRQRAAAGAVHAMPQERLGRGALGALSAPGDPMYLALGDSLASGSGLRDLRDGYVSRVHRALSERDGVPYGLENLGTGGETSASFLRDQLPAALDVLQHRNAAYMTIDLGGNDLLGDVRSQECAADITAPACRARTEATVEAYLANLDTILAGLRAAAPAAEIVFLTAYNPFNLGLGTRFEHDSDAALRDVNTSVAVVAAGHRVRVADGFAALAGTIPMTTGMAQYPPDIHPLPLGHDLLAAAVLDALSG